MMAKKLVTKVLVRCLINSNVPKGATSLERKGSATISSVRDSAMTTTSTKTSPWWSILRLSSHHFPIHRIWISFSRKVAAVVERTFNHRNLYRVSQGLTSLSTALESEWSSALCVLIRPPTALSSSGTWTPTPEQNLSLVPIALIAATTRPTCASTCGFTRTRSPFSVPSANIARTSSVMWSSIWPRIILWTSTPPINPLKRERNR